MFGDFDLAGISDFIQNDVMPGQPICWEPFRQLSKWLILCFCRNEADAGRFIRHTDAAMVASDFVHTLQDTWRAGTRLGITHRIWCSP